MLCQLLAEQVHAAACGQPYQMLWQEIQAGCGRWQPGQVLADMIEAQVVQGSPGWGVVRAAVPSLVLHKLTGPVKLQRINSLRQHRSC